MILIPFIPYITVFNMPTKSIMIIIIFKNYLKNKKINNSPLGFVTLNVNQDVLWKNRAAKCGKCLVRRTEYNSSSARAKSLHPTAPQFLHLEHGYRNHFRLHMFRKSK